MNTEVFATNFTYEGHTYVILEQTTYTRPGSPYTYKVTYGLTADGTRHYLSDDCPAIPTI